MSDFLKLFLPALIGMAKMIIDGAVKGEELTDHGKRVLVSAYVELSVWGQHLAADTENEYDDEAVESLLDMVVDTAEEAGLELPDLPEFAPPAA